MKKHKGQVLVGAILLVAVLAIIIPVMVMYVQNEARWSVKQGQNSNAFQLAEGALDRGYQKVIESTQSWKLVQSGQTLPGMDLATPFSDLAGGTYVVSVDSGPGEGEVTIVGIGRDKMKKETRALKAVYVNSILSDVSIAAAKGASMNGNNIEVEWGAVSSPQAINIIDKLHPTYWSAAGIDLDTNGSAPANCDSPKCWWWHSYYSALPPMPAIDFEAYKSSAIGPNPASPLKDSCGNYYYWDGTYTKTNFTACSSLSGGTYYVTGDWTDFKSAVVGNVIVKGNLVFSNGSQKTVGSYNATVPGNAWKQYCNDWSYYISNFDSTPPSTPACFGDINNAYKAAGKFKAIDPAIHGFMYVGGNMTLPNGGGSSDLLHGAIVVNGNADISSNSHCKIYYDPEVAAHIMTTGIYLVRKSWQDTVDPWPTALE